MFVVLDTNVLVSALWSKNGEAAKVLALVQNRAVTVCYDSRIMTEYRTVLERPKFSFTKFEIDSLLGQIEDDGFSIVALPLTIDFIDESDKKFFEVAKHCDALLITGNLKHFPNDPNIITIRAFLSTWS
jgi:putative PIN family toxin of toxin-antitoxin system